MCLLLQLHQLLLDDLNSRFWFTYRRDFPPIGEQHPAANSNAQSDVAHRLVGETLNTPCCCLCLMLLTPTGGSSLTSDVGWGCTLRSGQMLMAEVCREMGGLFKACLC